MPYRVLDDETTYDLAFVAWADTLQHLFRECWDATLSLTIENPEAIEAVDEWSFDVEHDSVDLLLCEFLDEFLYLKDSDGAVYRLVRVSIETPGIVSTVRSLVDEERGAYRLSATACGEPIDPERHVIGADIKGVTLYELLVEERDGGWFARVVLDV